MFELYGEDKLFQWDLNRKLIVEDGTIVEVHFANCLCNEARVCEVRKVEDICVVDIPNDLLMEYMDIKAWAWDGTNTKHAAIFEVEKRTKPASYVYEETEVLTFSDVLTRAENAAQLAEEKQSEVLELTETASEQASYAIDAASVAIGAQKSAEVYAEQASASAEVCEEAIKNIGDIINVAFASGSISGTDGSHSSSSARARSWFINANNVVRVEADAGYKIYLHCYGDGMAYCGNTNKLKIGSSGWAQEFDIATVRAGYPNLSYIRISLKKDDNTAFSTTLGDTFGKVRLIKDKVSSIKHESFGLPCIYLMGDTTDMTKDNKVLMNVKYFNNTTLTANGAVNEYTGQCEVKWQGSSSVRRGYPKRNYTIKFLEEVRIIYNWGARKKYCLKANWIDASQIRNIACANTWAECVSNRIGRGDSSDYTNTQLATAPSLGAVNGAPIILYINGEFEGLYTFNIPKDDWLFNMGDGAAEYIVGAESNNCASCGFLATPTFTGNEVQATLDFSIEYAPDDVEESAVIESFTTMANAIKNAPNSAEWTSAVEDYFDINSAIDYFIFNCCVSGYDNTRKNILYATYDGKKWFMSAYDLDATFGMDVYGEGVYEVNNTRNSFANVAHSAWNRLFYLIYNYSRAEFVARYKYLRGNILSDEVMWNRLAERTRQIPHIAYEEDAKRWPTMPSTSIANIHNYMDYYRMHCAYLDKVVANIEATLTTGAE